MVKIGSQIVYRDEVCTVTDIVEKYRNDEDYYFLTSAHDASLHIKVPVTAANKCMRPLISKTEIKALIRRIPEIEIVPIDHWSRGVEYKELLSDGSHESIIRIIKTAYLRQQERSDNHQKPNENDKRYFRHAERLLYSEIAAALGLEYNEAKEYIVSEVAALTPVVE